MAKHFLFFVGMIVVGCLAATDALAQNCLGRTDFDACMMGAVQSQQHSLSQQQQATFQAYLQQYGPWLQQQYPAYANQMSFEQFAYWMMMTANGTNVQGALNAQQQQFEGNQRANATVQQGYSDYNAGAAANSNAGINAVEGYDQGAVRGTSPQVDPNTGETVQLPYSDQPYNQPFNYGGQTYVNTPNGYFAWNGNGWVPVQPAQ